MNAGFAGRLILGFNKVIEKLLKDLFTKQIIKQLETLNKKIIYFQFIRFMLRWHKKLKK
tara:strand:+ start:743 stop:919 length:177 start_codon:yes stop_codon:yes gene_type:complete